MGRIGWFRLCAALTIACAVHFLTGCRREAARGLARPIAIAFVSAEGPEEPEEIYVINADGTGLRRLTNNKRSDLSPAWCPMGRRLPFTVLTLQAGRSTS